MSSGVKESAPRDGRARRWDSHRAQRRNAFVAAAIAAISRHGPDVHVEQIAQAAGVPRPVLYRHFKDRADLDAAIAHRAGELVLAELAPALNPTGTPLHSIGAIVETYLCWVESRPELYRFVVRRAQGGQHEPAGVRAAVAVRAADLLGGYFRWYRVDSAIAEPLAFGLVGMIDGAIDRWLEPGTAVDRVRLADRLTAAAWNVIDGELRAAGVEVDPHGPLPVLAAPTGTDG